MNQTKSSTYRVDGMSCGHCEVAVRGEVEKVRGVEQVDVDLSCKEVAVSGDFDDTAVRRAIDEAGYEAAA